MDGHKKVGMVALGCEKNRVDAEVMLAALEEHGCEICSDETQCDVIIIHTCAFIDKAKAESIENILRAAQMKKDGCCKKLIVTGCLAERYKEEIFESIPEADAILGSKSFDKICEAIDAPDSECYKRFAPLTCDTPTGPRILTSSPESVYLKIADGCSNHCSYCVIPSLRGEFMPRPADEIVSEAESLAKNGAVEINVIAQDTTAYPGLCELLKRLCSIDTVRWVRLLYCRPEEISDDLIRLMASEEKLVKYIDVPLQHASGKILKLMNRSMDEKSLYLLMKKLRDNIPGVSLRTTFIAGFPHETEEDFEILCDFIKRVRFNNLGVFSYSREEGTKAGRMKGQLPQETKDKRAEIIMSLQMQLLDSINAEFTGKTFAVFCEGFDEEKGLYAGRAYFQAPDIDSRIYFTSETPVTDGTFVDIHIDSAEVYDFYGHNVTKGT